LDWLVIPDILDHIRSKADLLRELRQAANGAANHDEWLNKLRRLRRREILRIGTRDILLGVSTRDIMLELSIMADAFIEGCLASIWKRFAREGRIPDLRPAPEDRFCVMALGKLGGAELNYSSDIDLLGLYGRPDSYGEASRIGSPDKDLFVRVMEGLRSDLSVHTEEGYAYRVDLRLRPFGRSGELVPALTSLVEYYRKKASLWEIQAALKMRPVAGNLQLGYGFLEAIRPLLLERRGKEAVKRSVAELRRAAVKQSASGLRPTLDVKSGVGGLRDVEFLVQGLQLINAPDNPELLEGNTLLAIDKLSGAGILNEEAAGQLSRDYIFLRRIEHCLQILEDRQVHALPNNSSEMAHLAKRILGPEGRTDVFLEQLNASRERVRDAFERYLGAGRT
jgi:glutamate-ammonia-ligase adenylyltransferase